MPIQEHGGDRGGEEPEDTGLLEEEPSGRTRCGQQPKVVLTFARRKGQRKHGAPRAACREMESTTGVRRPRKALIAIFSVNMRRARRAVLTQPEDKERRNPDTVDRPVS
jgi:hypothetical protein